MTKMTIWSPEGRMERIGIKTTPKRLEKLKRKRNGQLSRLIEKYKKINPKKANRLEARLSN